jgi:hypothetical protein
MNPFKTFSTNKRKEEDGVWVKGPEGSEFKVARMGNRTFAKLSGELFKPHRKMIQMGKMDDKLTTELAAEVTARTVLLDWKGLKDDKGADIPYSTEVAKKMLIDLPDFADLISGFSQQITLYQDEAKEEAVGNS